MIPAKWKSTGSTGWMFFYSQRCLFTLVCSIVCFPSSSSKDSIRGG